jgi:hypothetical protein
MQGLVVHSRWVACDSLILMNYSGGVFFVSEFKIGRFLYGEWRLLILLSIYTLLLNLTTS